MKNGSFPQILLRNVGLITLVTPNPNEMQAMGMYAKQSSEIAQRSGALVLKKLSVSEQIYGDAPAAIIGIAQFPSREAVETMFGSDEYQQLVPMRDKGVSALNVYVSQPGQTFTANGNGEHPVLVTMAVPNSAEKATLGQYQQGAGPVAGKYGAKPVAKIGIADNIIGDTPAAFLSMAQFPSDDAIKGMFSDDAYQPLVPLRDKALASLNLYIAQ